MKTLDEHNKENLIFSEAELNLFREWFHSMETINPRYLEPKDYKVYLKIQNYLGNPVRDYYYKMAKKRKKND